MKRIKKIILMIFLLTTLFVNSIYTIAYIFDITNPITNIFKPYSFTERTLRITKKLIHPYKDTYQIPSNIEFTYQINLGSFYQNKLITTSLGNYQTNEMGIINLTIKPNTELIIYDLEEGMEIKISNLTELNGFTFDKKEETLIVSNDNNIEFTATYNSKSLKGETISLNGIVNLTNRQYQSKDKFKILLEYQNSNKEWIELATKELKYSLENPEFNKFNFNEVLNNYEFDTLKTYKFRISQINTNLENLKYDMTINNFEVNITDNDMDGYIEINDITSSNNLIVSKKDDKYILDVSFNNQEIIEEENLEYIDLKDNSLLVDDKIIVKDEDYDIKTILSKFKGLGNKYTYNLYDKFNNIQKHTLIRTSDSLKIFVNQNEYKYNLILLGDVSGDGEITPLDYVKVKNHVTNNKVITENIYQIASDITFDNNITKDDYTEIKNHIMLGGE